MSLVAEPAVADVPLPPLRKNRDFLLLWIGAGFTLLGARVSGIAYPLLILWSTGSPVMAGLAGFAVQLPNLLVQLPAGALVDRWNRRRLMIVCDIVCFLAIGSVALALYFGKIWLPQLMLAGFTQGSMTIFYRLAERAGVRHLVPPGQLPAAFAGNEARSQAAGLLGQPVGSVLFVLARSVPFIFTAFAHLASLVSLLLIKKEFQDERTQRPGKLSAEVREGLAWTWRQKFLRNVMGIIAGTNILFQALTLALIVIIHRDHGSAAIVGGVLAAAGMGGVLGALTGSVWMKRFTLRALVIGGLAGWAILMPLVAVSGNPFALIAVFAAMSYVGGVFNVAGGVYQVRITPDAMQGRVNSVLTLLGSGTNSLGALAGGFLIASLGTTHTVLGIGGAMIFLVVVSVVSPAVRREKTSLYSPVPADCPVPGTGTSEPGMKS